MLDYSVGRRDRSTRNGDLRSEEVTSAREGPVRGAHLNGTIPLLGRLGDHYSSKVTACLSEEYRRLGCSSVGRCTTCPRISEECGAQTLCDVVATRRLLPLGVPPCPREAAAWTRDAPERERPPVGTRSLVRDRCPGDGLIVGSRQQIA